MRRGGPLALRDAGGSLGINVSTDSRKPGVGYASGAIIGNELGRRIARGARGVEVRPSDALLASLGHGRQALHAHRLTLPHPRTGEPLTLESPLATDLEELWASPGAALRGHPVRGWDVLYGAQAASTPSSDPHQDTGWPDPATADARESEA